MRGKILGFADGKGVIIGDGDARYSFTTENWRDAQPPRKGQGVDFVAKEDGTADDIYAALGAFSGALGDGGAKAGAELSELIGDVKANDTVQNVVSRVRTYPQAVLAIVILLAFFMMTYAKVGVDANGLRELGVGGAVEEVSLFGLNGALSPLRESVGVAREQLDVSVENARSAQTSFGFSAERVRELEQVRSKLTTLSWFWSAAHLFWLIPLLAGGLLYFQWKERRALVSVSAMALGVLSIFSGLYVKLWEWQIIGAVPQGMRPRMRPIVERAFELEFGGWLIVLCGIGLLALPFILRRKEA